MRRFGEPFLRGKRYLVRPGAYAVLIRDGKILLTHQTAPVPEYQLPGGGIEKGEQVLPALYREILEETGWSAAGLRRVGVYKRFTFMAEYNMWAEKICTIYAGRPILDKGEPIEKDHHAVFVPINLGLKLLTNSGDQSFAKSVVGMTSNSNITPDTSSSNL